MLKRDFFNEWQEVFCMLQITFASQIFLILNYKYCHDDNVKRFSHLLIVISSLICICLGRREISLIFLNAYLFSCVMLLIS